MNVHKRQLKVGVIGKDGRTSAIIRLLESSQRVATPVVVLSTGKGSSLERVVEEARAGALVHQPDFVVIGPEEPLASGVVDVLQNDLGIPCVGPTAKLAKLESSKAFTRQLLSKHKIPGNPKHKIFTSSDGIESYLRDLGEFVIKPDGLTGGKGVKVSGEHLTSAHQALDYCKELFDSGHSRVIVEEKLDGEEFSLQSFCDGSSVKHMVVVQDHKRAFDGDTGPNTGGMGSYTCTNHLLPFITKRMLEEAKEINRLVPPALLRETGDRYKGILFGGFMATRNGVKLLEYNARFGDPEALNVLSLLETDLCEIFLAIIEGRLDTVPVTFKRKATVCKYIVPTGYPTDPIPNGRLEAIPCESDNLKVYRAAVDQSSTGLVMTGSRAMAVVGIGEDLNEANRVAEAAAKSVEGPVFYRKDIGTSTLIERRVQHMKSVLSVGRPSPSRAAAGAGTV